MPEGLHGKKRPADAARQAAQTAGIAADHIKDVHNTVKSAAARARSADPRRDLRQMLS